MNNKKELLRCNSPFLKAVREIQESIRRRKLADDAQILVENSSNFNI